MGATRSSNFITIYHNHCNGTNYILGYFQQVDVINVLNRSYVRNKSFVIQPFYNSLHDKNRKKGLKAIMFHEYMVVVTDASSDAR